MIRLAANAGWNRTFAIVRKAVLFDSLAFAITVVILAAGTFHNGGEIMFARIEQLTGQMDRRPPASILRLSEYLNIGTFAPPRDYLKFMRAEKAKTG